jgi:hypothetical protein
MKKRFGNYRRLARGSFSCSSLWLGNGHLLYVKGNGVLVPLTEEYLRFELRRIHGIALIRTQTGTVKNIVCGLMVAAFGIATVASAWNWSRGASPGVWAFFTLCFALMATGWTVGLVINWLRGPTCLVTVQTPVRCERLRPLRRLRIAERVLAELGPAIDQAQQSEGPAAAAPQPAPSPLAPTYQPT